MSTNAKSVGSRLSVSVALATYNGAEFIEEQIRSIVAQTLVPGELVLSDDGSTDNTIDRARVAFDSAVAAVGAPDIRLVVRQNSSQLGPAANFEAACAATTGDLIALCDQDDLWESDRIASMVAEFESSPGLVLLHSDATLVDAEGVEVAPSLLRTLRLSAAERRAIASGREFDVLLRRNVVTGATTMIRRELLEVARPFPAGWVHDEWLGLVAAATGQVRLLDRPLTRYRQHAANQIGAAGLTLATGLGRMREPRNQRNARLLEHAQATVARLDALGERVQASDRAKSDAKLRHETFRSGLPVARPARVVPVLAAVLRGQYRRYSRGWADAIRDVIQPA